MNETKVLTYQIVRWDKVNNDLEKVGNFTGTIAELTEYLYAQQLGYCEGEEKPTIIETSIMSDGMPLQALIAESSVDYCYMSVIKITGSIK